MIMGCQRAVRLEQVGQSVIWPHPFRFTVCAVVRHAFSADQLHPGETLSPLKVVSHTLVVVGAAGLQLASAEQGPSSQSGNRK
jgi:hypothetical protein